MEQNIIKLIEEDIANLNNNGCKIQRKNSLMDYYNNPKYCEHCNQMIYVDIGARVSDIKKKRFCNRSCAASKNNSLRQNLEIPSIKGNAFKILLESYSDEQLRQIIEKSTSYKDIYEYFGYSRNGNQIYNSIIREKIKDLKLDNSFDKFNILQNTKGELFDKRNSWQSARSDIQKWARRIYEDSDKLKKCHICGYDKHYEVAHIKAVSDFSDNVLIQEINDIHNLIALCPNCHWEFDNGLLNINN